MSEAFYYGNSNTAKKITKAYIGVNGGVNTEGSVAKAEADAKQYTDDKIGTLAEGETVESTYQTIANKVTDLSGAVTVTDTQYPSALAVKTALTSTGGDVTALSNKVGSGNFAADIAATDVVGAINEVDAKIGI